MTSNGSPTPQNEEFWRDFLTNGDSRDRKLRGIYRRIPSEPRCQLCAAQGGEVLVTTAAATAAALDATLDRRELELRGREERTEVVSLRIGPTS
jgi:hypothetical protein